MFKRKLIYFMLILSIVTCIAGCSDKKENANNTTTTIENSDNSQNNTTTPSDTPSEEPTTKPAVPEKEESLVWDGTTVYINDENGMKLFKEDTKRENVTKAVIKNGITYIDSKLFFNCQRLEEVVIPDTVLIIRYMAFCNCFSLKEVTLPDTLLSIDVGAFYNCKNLSAIALPKNIDIIPTWCFYDCNNLRYIECKGNIAQICSQAFIENNSIYGTTYLMLSTDPTNAKADGTQIANDAFSRSSTYIYNKYGLWYNSDSITTSICDELYANDICTEVRHIWGDAPGCRMEYPCILCGELSDDISPHNYDEDMVCTKCGYGSDEYDEDTPDSSNADNYKTFTTTDNKTITVTITDNEIKVKTDDGTETFSISELMKGNEPTNNNPTPSLEGVEQNDDNSVSHFAPGYLAIYVPKQIAYDTELVFRNPKYEGMLFGQYYYRIKSELVEKYNIDKYTVIASYYNSIFLGYDEDNERLKIQYGRVDMER